MTTTMTTATLTRRQPRPTTATFWVPSEFVVLSPSLLLLAIPTPKDCFPLIHLFFF
ncbi:hypothetical protein BDN72DRAFT_842004 [Pluteus cervinus]|uniref:Uncharacterized protein n=1 Tax=Pluteus cervinus TaxID=181527 RepID=A0ACD3ARZ0_9AGAR|nr:hypothetical protein BDN72DRAFT_842004 [Pluteus cervinus]